MYEAQTGVITEAELLRTVTSIDKEDGTTKIRVKDYSASTFTGLTGSGEITITYTTIDSRNNMDTAMNNVKGKDGNWSHIVKKL